MGNKKIRLGMLGAGRIVGRVMADMHRLENVEITAIAARDLDRAKEAADRYGIPYAYGSYLELAQSNEVDLVYIATPHPFHAQQSILMMNHGKHVICEKPMAINHHEVQQMMDCAKENNVFLMDACGNEYMQIFGTKGYISMPACWHPKEFTLCLDGQKEQLFTFEHQGEEAYHYEFDHAAECILQGMKESPVMPLEESLIAAHICTDIRFEHGIIYPGDKE